MNKSTIVMVCVVLLSGCGGAKVLKEPEPLAITQSLATASDQTLSATLDWVIYRDGPGAWAKNVDWDEYLIRVQNLSGESLRIIDIIVVDSLGTQIELRQTRRQLVKGTKQTKRRYKGEGLKVKAGVSAGTLLAAGAITAVTTASVGAAAVYGSSAMAAGAFTGLIFVPVLAVGGVFRGLNNRQVSKQIVSRQTLLPITLQKDEEKGLHIFFPLSPSPQRLEITYADSQGTFTLIIDTQGALAGLHIVQAK